MGLAGVILAAGESTRMGRDKALLPWPTGPSPQSVGPGVHLEVGERSSPWVAERQLRASGTLISTAIEALGQYCDLVIVVAGNNEAALEPVVYGCGAFLVRNPNPEFGQFSSLQTGLREVLKRGRDKAMVTLVDRPPAEPQTLASLLDAFAKKEHAAWAVVPEYHGKHGHPIVIGREMIEAFLKAPATSNAREVEHVNQLHISYLAVNDALVASNINTPEDYASLQLQRS
jgi:molybdenum cofactor cytidylyltransferase